jgi:hypothetical protein
MDVKRWPPNVIWRFQRYERHGTKIPLVRIGWWERKLQYLSGNSLAKVSATWIYALFSKFIRSSYTILFINCYENLEKWISVRFASSQVLANVDHEFLTNEGRGKENYSPSQKSEEKFAASSYYFYSLSSNQQDEACWAQRQGKINLCLARILCKQ